MKKVIIAGGCFWGVEAYYKRLKGIETTMVGYTDGLKANPTYEEVCRSSGHVEAVLLEFDEQLISLRKIIEHFLRIVDPTAINRQGNDIGIQYRSGIYVFEEKDKILVQELLEEAQKHYSRKIQTKVLPAGPFYRAEEYHQGYLEKKPHGYCHVNLHLAKKDELKEGI
ncbi:MAG: peptide-methionine (S)-S-oxide reductase MsrA [Candidatus Izemoplasmatales bacterium]|jgi:methionine-S-sulfoxide reductase